MKRKKNVAVEEPQGRNEIVVYQPDDITRLPVRFDGKTVWLLQTQIAELFGCSLENVRLHLKNIYAIGELSHEATSKESLEVRQEGLRQVRRIFTYYNLEAIISIGFRVNSIIGVKFRQWATKVIQDRMMAGSLQNARFALIDQKLATHDRDIVELKEKVDFFVQTQTPPLQGVFYDGQIWDAAAFVTKLIASAKKSIWLIDNWATVATLDMLAKKKKGVAVTVVTSEHITPKTKQSDHKIKPTDIKKFNAQYPKLTVKFSENFHDRFLILDDRDIYLIGASLKDLGKKCFGFVKMDAGEIAGIKPRV